MFYLLRLPEARCSLNKTAAEVSFTVAYRKVLDELLIPVRGGGTNVLPTTHTHRQRREMSYNTWAPQELNRTGKASLVLGNMVKQ